MTHEGRMARGKEKLSKGVKDSETQYYLNEGGKKMSEEETNPEKEEESKEEEDGESD